MPFKLFIRAFSISDYFHLGRIFFPLFTPVPFSTIPVFPILSFFIPFLLPLNVYLLVSFFLYPFLSLTFLPTFSFLFLAFLYPYPLSLLFFLFSASF